MLANVSIVVAILSWQICNAPNEVGLFHINRDLVGKWDQSRTIFAVPECIVVAIDSIRGWVAALSRVGNSRPSSV